MSKCSFSIPHSGDAEGILLKANAGITAAGGTFAGNATGGQFSLSTFIGDINGTFTTDASNLNVEVTDKPMFLSCTQIEQELRKRLGV